MGFDPIKKTAKHIKTVLLKDESVRAVARQSFVGSLAPTIIFGTNKRLIIVHNSFWGLWVGANMFAATSTGYVPYANIAGVNVIRGKLLSTLHLDLKTHAPGATQEVWKIEGIPERELELLVNYINDEIESIQQSPAQAKY